MQLCTFLVSFLVATVALVSADSSLKVDSRILPAIVDVPVSKRFCNIVKNAKPAVVCIRTERRAVDDLDFEAFQRELYQRFFPGREAPEAYSKPARGLGSGVIISSDGFIITNAHVINGANKIEVILDNGEVKAAVLRGIDPYSDIGLIKIEGSGWPYLPWGDSDSAEVGEEVMAIGSPATLRGSCATGIISFINRSCDLTTDGHFIQVQIPITFGSSGGALLNMNGDLIGITTGIIAIQNGQIGLVIPSGYVRHIANQLREKGRVSRGYLGVVVQSIDDGFTAKALKMTESKGVLIASVEKGSPADKAGLKQGDVLIAYNGTPIETPYDFRRTTSMTPPGSEVVFKAYRKGEKIVLKAILGEREESRMGVEGVSQKLGILEVQSLTPDSVKQPGCPLEEEGGVIVTKTRPGSLVDQEGFTPGCIIKSINGIDVNTVAEYNKTLTEECLKDEKVVLCVVYTARGQKFMKFCPFSVK
jgi:serine protease Do